MECDKFKNYCNRGSACSNIHDHSSTSLEELSRKLDIVIHKINQIQTKQDKAAQVLLFNAKQNNSILMSLSEIKNKVTILWRQKFHYKIRLINEQLDDMCSETDISRISLKDRGSTLFKKPQR